MPWCCCSHSARPQMINASPAPRSIHLLIVSIEQENGHKLLENKLFSFIRNSKLLQNPEK
eukprot:1936295-Amphidinium_carterae.1